MIPLPEDFPAAAEAAAGEPLPPGAADALARLLALLREENEVQNLTSILEPGDMVVDHLLDSLAIAGAAARAGAPVLWAGPCVDVGSGAGFPGVPLAVAFPGVRWVLVESEGRKADWLRRVTGALGLGNVEVFHGRSRELRHNRKDLEHACGLVTARAVGDLGRIAREARGLLRPGGVLLCPKGPGLGAEERALGEREAGKSRYAPGEDVPMAVPDRHRFCVVYRRE